MKIPIIIHLEKFELSEYWRSKVKQAVKDAGAPIRAEIHTLLPESRNQRKYVMGGLIPLLVYLDGNDYRDSETCDRYFETFKREFTPETMVINGKVEVFGKSSKGGKALQQFTEKLQEFLNDEYGIAYDSKAVNVDEYKKFRDEIYSFSPEYEDWIDYCRKMKYIK